MRNSHIIWCVLLGIVLSCNVMGVGQTKSKRSRQAKPLETGLTRRIAGQMISRRVETGPNKTINVYVNDARINKKELQDEAGERGLLVRLEYLECKVIPESMTKGSYLSRPQVVPEYCEIVLTKKGVTASADWEVFMKKRAVAHLIDKVTITVAKPDFIEVTGVAQEGIEAIVTYTWRMRPVNEIGEALDKKEVLSGVLEFIKFDDGWRFKR